MTDLLMTSGRMAALVLTAGLTALWATPTSTQRATIAPGRAALIHPVRQDAAKQEEKPPPTPKVGFSRKDDRTVLECVDFFWHEVTYAVYLADHMPNLPPVNIKLVDKNTGKPCRAPAPEHLPGPGGELPDAPHLGLKRRDDIVVQECIDNTWHKITFAFFEHWDEKDEPDFMTLPIRVKISDEDTGDPCTPIASPQPQPPASGGGGSGTGTSTLGSSHARSECKDDGFWHVITDEDWIRPDGTHFTKQDDKKTTHTCKAGDPIPSDLPGRTQPKEAGERIEDKEIKECINGFYWYRKYAQYRRADGSTWVDSGPDKWVSQTTKNEPCPEKTGGGGGSSSGNVGMSTTPTAGVAVSGEPARTTVPTPVVTLGAGGPMATSVNLIPGSCCNVKIQIMIIERLASTFVPASSFQPVQTPSGWGLLARAVLGLPSGSRLVKSARWPGDGAAGRLSFTVAAAREPTQPTSPVVIKALVTSLGKATGEAFEMRLFNDSHVDATVEGDGVVVEAYTPDAAAQGRRLFDQRAAATPVVVKLNGYCLEMDRLPPSSGQPFRIGAADVQQKFAPLRSIVRAARKLQDARQLQPDGDPVEYVHSMK